MMRLPRWPAPSKYSATMQSRLIGSWPNANTLDLETVLSAIVTKATQLSGTETGTMYVFNESNHEYELCASYGMTESLIESIKDQHAGISEALARAIEGRQPMQTPDLREELPSEARDVILRAGYLA